MADQQWHGELIRLMPGAGMQPTGLENDGWALGCTLYEMVMGEHLCAGLPDLLPPRGVHLKHLHQYLNTRLGELPHSNAAPAPAVLQVNVKRAGLSVQVGL